MIINPFDNEQEFTSSDKLITHLTQLAVDKNNVFRGYGKQSELFPNIIREKDWREQEIRLLHEFERYGLQYFSANNPIDFMSYAQHYGLPTRLLDFTYNPFIALYFSLFTPKGTNYRFSFFNFCSSLKNIAPIGTTRAKKAEGALPRDGAWFLPSACIVEEFMLC